MFDIIIVVVCAWFTYSNVRLLMEVPLSNWALEQYLLAVVSLLLVVVGLYKLWQVVKAFIGGQLLARQRAEELRREGGAPAPDEDPPKGGEDPPEDDGQNQDPPDA